MLRESFYQNFTNPYDRSLNLKDSDLIVVSRHRWNERDFGRTHQLSLRFARHRRVYFIEPPVFVDTVSPQFAVANLSDGPTVLTPQLPMDLSSSSGHAVMEILLDRLIQEEFMSGFSIWVDCAERWPSVRHLRAAAVIWDCATTHDLNMDLLQAADLVVVPNRQVFEVVRRCHHNARIVPDGVEVAAYNQKALRPKVLHIAVFGSVWETLDIKLLERIANFRPQWKFLVFDVAREPTELSNLQFIGRKAVHERPAFLQICMAALFPLKETDYANGWMPAEILDCLAAQLPVVTAPLPAIVEEVGHLAFVSFARSYPDYVMKLDASVEMQARADDLNGLQDFVAGRDWDEIWRRTAQLEASTLGTERLLTPALFTAVEKTLLQ